MKNGLTISNEEIRKSLKRWDGFLPSSKVSNTKALLDNIYSIIEISMLRQYIGPIISEWVKIGYRKTGVSDCDNAALWMQSDFGKRWAEERISDYEPAIFRIVIDGIPLHSLNLAFTDCGEKFIDPQTGRIFWDDKLKILAVT